MTNTLDDASIYFSEPVWKRFLKNKMAKQDFQFYASCFYRQLWCLLQLAYSHFATNREAKNHTPNLHYWFGTDDLGRDLFTRIWYGARISLTIGIAAAFIDVIVGVFWGSIAAYAGGKTEDLMMGFANLLYSLPYPSHCDHLSSLVLGSGFHQSLLRMTILGWISMARIVRERAN